MEKLRTAIKKIKPRKLVPFKKKIPEKVKEILPPPIVEDVVIPPVDSISEIEIDTSSILESSITEMLGHEPIPYDEKFDKMERDLDTYKSSFKQKKPKRKGKLGKHVPNKIVVVYQ